MTLSGVIATWLARGEGTQELTNLTGRTKVWGPLLAFPRDKFQEIFGFGLSNGSFNGLPIDSNWLASYQEQGLFGVVVCATMLVFLLVTAYFQPRGVQRALALFLVTYCLVASFTEVGFTDVSPYLLELTLAASLLVPPADRPETDMRTVSAIPAAAQPLNSGTGVVPSMDEQTIQRFWQDHACGDAQVGGLRERFHGDYDKFFTDYDQFRYQNERAPASVHRGPERSRQAGTRDRPGRGI